MDSIQNIFLPAEVAIMINVLFIFLWIQTKRSNVKWYCSLSMTPSFPLHGLNYLHLCLRGYNFAPKSSVVAKEYTQSIFFFKIGWKHLYNNTTFSPSNFPWNIWYLHWHKILKCLTSQISSSLISCLPIYWV